MYSHTKKLVGFLSYKTKLQTTDFKVVEITDLNVGDTGSYYVYKLTKEGWNTVDALIRIAKENRLPLRHIQYGGKKDRHGITTQFITSQKRLQLPDSLAGAVQLDEIGKSNEPMSPRRITGNQFVIVLRSLHVTELSHLEQNFASLKKVGFTNYFDSQRFSTFDREKGLPAFALYRGNYEEALKLLLLGTFRREKSNAKDRKAELTKQWRSWSNCLTLADTAVERRVFSFLKAQLDSQSNAESVSQQHFAAALDLLPFEELLMMLSAFQAYLWNNIIAMTIDDQSKGKAAFFKTRSGILCFAPPSVSIRNQQISLPGIGQQFDDTQQSYLGQILTQLQIKQDSLTQPHLTSAAMNAYFRDIQIMPGDLSISAAEDDELSIKRKKVTLQCTLPAGSYGTMLVKRLTLRARF